MAVQSQDEEALWTLHQIGSIGFQIILDHLNGLSSDISNSLCTVSYLLKMSRNLLNLIWISFILWSTTSMKFWMRDSIPRATALCLISCVMRVESISGLVLLRLVVNSRRAVVQWPALPWVESWWRLMTSGSSCSVLRSADVESESCRWWPMSLLRVGMFRGVT
jgi:hypothetical protein